jgi:hypothetical protein
MMYARSFSRVNGAVFEGGCVGPLQFNTSNCRIVPGNEFGAILKSEGIDGLIAPLNRKTDILNASTQGLSRTNPGTEAAGVLAREPTTGPRAQIFLPPSADPKGTESSLLEE